MDLGVYPGHYDHATHMDFWPRFDLPNGLTRASLTTYASIARRAIAEGMDEQGLQEVRLRAIERLLEQMP